MSPRWRVIDDFNRFVVVWLWWTRFCSTSLRRWFAVATWRNSRGPCNGIHELDALDSAWCRSSWNFTGFFIFLYTWRVIFLETTWKVNLLRWISVGGKSKSVWVYGIAADPFWGWFSNWRGNRCRRIDLGSVWWRYLDEAWATGHWMNLAQPTAGRGSESPPGFFELSRVPQPLIHAIDPGQTRFDCWYNLFCASGGKVLFRSKL